jgi:hypothetical protein
MSTGVAEKIKTFKTQLQTIRLDPNLSDEGREKQVKAIQKALTDYGSVALGILRREADAIRKEYHDLNFERYPRAIEAEARRWDYPRLGYARSHMEAELAALKATTGDPLPQIEKRYSQVMSGGDVYQQLVWSELGPGAVLQFGGAALAKVMEENAARLRDTPDLQAIQSESGQLALRAAALQREVRDVTPEFDYETQLSLQKSMAGIHVTERIDAPTLALITELHVDEATPTAEAAPVGAPAPA